MDRSFCVRDLFNPAFLCFVLFVLAATDVMAGKRVALVVGNARYQGASRLINPTSDAALIGEKLTELGFHVLLYKDLSFSKFTEALRSFEAAMQDAEAAVFFYAGHGIQYKKENYLLAVDAHLKDEQDVVVSGKNLSDIVQSMEARVPLSIAFIDACRDNPFTNVLLAEMTSKSRATKLDRGLAPIMPTRANTLVAYATRPGGVAADGDEMNSPFSAALSKHIATPNLEISTMLKRVTRDVATATDQSQRPEIVSTMDAEFYFFPMAAETPVLNTEGSDEERELAALIALNKASAIDTIAAYRLVISNHPGTRASDTADQVLKRKLSAALAQQNASTKADKTSQLAVSTEALLAKLDEVVTSRPETKATAQRPEDGEASLALGTAGYKQVQDALRMLGYDVGITDGVFATKSREALREFQIASRFEGTGYIDQRSLVALITVFSDTPRTYDGLWTMEIHRFNPNEADPARINDRTHLASINLRIADGVMNVVTTQNNATQRQLFSTFRGSISTEGKASVRLDIDYLFGSQDKIKRVDIQGTLPQFVAYGNIVKLAGPMVERVSATDQTWIRIELSRKKT